MAKFKGKSKIFRGFGKSKPRLGFWDPRASQRPDSRLMPVPPARASSGGRVRGAPIAKPIYQVRTQAGVPGLGRRMRLY